MKPALAVTALCAGLVVALYSWPSAGVLFTQLPKEPSHVSARGVAFALIIASYGIFFWLLAVAARHLPVRWPSLVTVLVIGSMAVCGSLAAPFFALLPLFAARAVCWSTTMCAAPGFMQYLPHALFVSSTYPAIQLLLAFPFLVLLLAAARGVSNGRQGAFAREL